MFLTRKSMRQEVWEEAWLKGKGGGAWRMKGRGVSGEEAEFEKGRGGLDDEEVEETGEGKRGKGAGLGG